MSAPMDTAAASAQLLELINAAWTTQVVRAACVHRLPDRIAAGTADTAALAAATDCDADALERLLRAMASIGLCEADAAGGRAPARWRLAPVGECLRTDHPTSLHHWALHAGGPLWQRQGELAQAVRTGHNWAQRRGSEHAYAQLLADPAAAAVFHAAMVELTRVALPQILPLVEIGSARVVVDIGGGRGELLGALLARHPAARGVLFDQPSALEGAREQLARSGVAERCRIEGGDFFAAVPGGADLYLMKSVLHNWSDRHCRTLLQACAAAMPPGARLLVIERLVPQAAGRSAKHRTSARSDLNMLVGLTGRERDAGAYEQLLSDASLVVVRTRSSPAPSAPGATDAATASPSGDWAVLEARRAGD
jgi:trans-aconitate methyltransferase